jgi:hypothetical protein
MIVTYHEKGWQVVTQRAHGILAAQIAFHWNVRKRPLRWVETLLAIGEHDDAEIELDGEKLLTESGGPLNYSMKEFELKHCQRLALLTVTKSRYIALLTSQHMEFLYRKDAGSNKDAYQFLKDQEQLRLTLLAELGMKKHELEEIYALLEWCDAFSLLLCQCQVPKENRTIEISTGPNKKPYQLSEMGSGILTVEPWPFEARAFHVSFESRFLKQLEFQHSSQFRKAFTESEVAETNWEIKKKPVSYHKPKKTIV